jgi:hypothetical protein
MQILKRIILLLILTFFLSIELLAQSHLFKTIQEIDQIAKSNNWKTVTPLHYQNEVKTITYANDNEENTYYFYSIKCCKRTTRYFSKSNFLKAKKELKIGKEDKRINIENNSTLIAFGDNYNGITFYKGYNDELLLIDCGVFKSK